MADQGRSPRGEQNRREFAEPVIIEGSVETELANLPDSCVQTTITSPPYYRQKDYQAKGQLGWELTVAEYVAKMKKLFEELWRVTHGTGCCFFVVGDTYVNKALQLVPQRLAIAACEVGWTIRNDLVWAKSDAAPDGAADRWRFSHEHVLFMAKAARGYKFNADEIRVPYSPVTLRRWADGQQYGGAKDWAYLKHKRENSTKRGQMDFQPVVIWFNVSRDELARLDTLSFVRGDFSAAEYWSFVQHCRSSVRPTKTTAAVVRHHERDSSGTPTWYDMVSGPVAAFWQQRCAMLEADQYSFHTRRGIDVLNHLLASGSMGSEYDVEQVVV